MLAYQPVCRQRMRNGHFPYLRRLLTEASSHAPETHFTEAGFFPDATTYCLLLCVPEPSERPARDQAVHELMYYHLQDAADPMRYARLDMQVVIWLVQMPCERNRRNTTRLFGQLETTQTSCTAAFGMALSIIIQPFDLSEISFRQACVSAQTPLMPEVVSNDIGGITIDWVRQYVEENITIDVSLMRLSSYVAERRMQLMRALLSEKDKTPQ